jgi:hypothetical protein
LLVALYQITFLPFLMFWEFFSQMEIVQCQVFFSSSTEMILQLFWFFMVVYIDCETLKQHYILGWTVLGHEVLFFCVWILTIKLRALHLLSKHSTTWAMPHVLLLLTCFSDKASCFLPQVWPLTEILLPIPLGIWDYRCVSPCPVCSWDGILDNICPNVFKLWSS